MKRLSFVLLGFCFLIPACLPEPEPQPVPGREGLAMPEGTEMALQAFASEVIAEGFTTPVAIEVLSESEYLVADRIGELVHIKDGVTTELDGFPAIRTVKTDRRYGGVLDVSLHPAFEDNDLVYVSYINRDYHLVVARFSFRDRTIEDWEIVREFNYFVLGARIEWEDDDHFFVSAGMAGAPYADSGPQDLNNDGGKIHRLMSDGSTPPDNPTYPGYDAPSSIWSYGHRDVQGLYLDNTSGSLFATEHGPLGGDELNRIEAGANYGWPRFSYGLNYDGTPVGDWSEEEADSLSVLPIKTWEVSFNQAPSTLERINIPGMGERFVWGSLVQQRLIAYDTVSGMTSVVLDEMGRIRDVKQLPDGDLIILIDEESSIDTYAGSVVRISFAEGS